MESFIEGVKLFHSLCGESRLLDAAQVLGELCRRAEALPEYTALGYAQSRLGMFEDAERTLDLVWPHLPPKELNTIHVASERAVVKFHLGKLDEAVAIEKLIHGRAWYRVSAAIDPAVRDTFNRLFQEKLLEDQSSIQGKSVFLVLTGGLGDAIEQIRNVQHLRAEGARSIVVDPREPLRTLLANSALPMTFERASIETMSGCDAIAFGNMLSWRYYAVERSPAQRPGYLAQTGGTERPLSISESTGKRKIGIVWRSNNASWQQCRHEPFRSMELTTMEPLLINSRNRFYSLQFGQPTDAERHILERHHVVDTSPYIHSLADMASIITQLDLVLTIDSVSAHLSGALGVPVWTMLAAVADWRWGDASQHVTALYPCMRLFRQPKHGDWAPVISAIAAELA